MNEHELRQKIIEIKNRALEKQLGCFCPNCKEDAIKSHTISKRELRSVLTGEKFYYLSINLHKPGLVEISDKKGVNKFSTFYGFCRDHDNNLFEEIDNLVDLDFSDKEKVEKILFLSMFRRVSQELYLKKAHLQGDLDVKDFYENNNIGYFREGFDFAEKGLRMAIKDLTKLYNKLASDLVKNKFNKIKYKVYSFDSLPIALSSVYAPVECFEGCKIQDLKDGNILSIISFFTFHTPSKHYMVFVWHKTDNGVCQKFISSIKKDKDLKSMLLDFCIFHAENLVIKKDWWESLEKEKQEKYLESFKNEI